MDVASASEAVDAGLIAVSGQAEDFRKLAFIAFLLGVRFSNKGDSVETKPASSLVVFLEKALQLFHMILPALSGRQLAIAREKFDA